MWRGCLLQAFRPAGQTRCEQVHALGFLRTGRRAVARASRNRALGAGPCPRAVNGGCAIGGA
eukprot:11481345-Alexandrium_andersonii.AAC.1